MPFMQVYVSDALEREIPLQTKVTTIGRGQDCDICIDNSGVSELHARIRLREGRYFIEDAKSRNGILHNGQQVTQNVLAYGDELSLLKHRLIFVEQVSASVCMPARPQSFDAILQDETVEVDIANLRQRLQTQESGGGACLLLQGVRGMRADYPIKKVNFSIGKSSSSDLYLTGLFAPAKAASIKRRADGYYIESGLRGKVRVNGMPTRGSHKLSHGDGLQVRNIRLSFQERRVVQEH
jgi:predicted component of type VI protein secretion system